MYQGVDGALFDIAQPCSLFHVPDLELVVAGLNSTIAYSHRDSDRHGQLGEAQSAWFAHQLRTFEQTGWLRIGTVFHHPQPAGAESRGGESAALRDTDTFDRLLADRLDLLLPGSRPRGVGDMPGQLGTWASGPVVMHAPAPGGMQLLVLDADGVSRWTDASRDRHRVSHERLHRRWRAAYATFPAATPIGASGPGTPAVPGELVPRILPRVDG